VESLVSGMHLSVAFYVVIRSRLSPVLTQVREFRFKFQRNSLLVNTTAAGEVLLAKLPAEGMMSHLL